MELDAASRSADRASCLICGRHTTLTIAGLTREEPGNVEFNIYKPNGTVDQLLIFERWTERSALEQHWEWNYTKHVLTLFDENLLHPLSQSDDVMYLSDVLGTPPSR